MRNLPASRNVATNATRVQSIFELAAARQLAGAQLFWAGAPELNFRSSINNLQQQASYDQQAIGDLQMSNLPTTGHPVMFLNTRGYFQSPIGGSRGSAGVQGMSAPGGAGR